MADKHEDTGQDRNSGNDESPVQDATQEGSVRRDGVPENGPAVWAPEGPAGSGFTEAQLAEIQGMFASAGRPGLRGRVRGWWRRNRARARDFIQAATPPDSEADFDEDTFTGWLAVRASKHRGITAVLVVLAVLVLGGLWVMVLGGGLPLAIAALVAVIVLALPVAAGVVFRRRHR
ncbi:hypothetical protein ACX801_18015 [Arthrobacter bambusae]